MKPLYGGSQFRLRLPTIAPPRTAELNEGHIYEEVNSAYGFRPYSPFPFGQGGTKSLIRHAALPHDTFFKGEGEAER